MRVNRYPTLFVAVSSHGFGHLAQTAPVVNALWQHLPQLRVVVQTTAPKPLLARYFARSFEHLPVVSDVGMVMSSSLDVRVEESAAAHAGFHRTWRERLERQTGLLRRFRADAVLANVPYLLPAAAARLGTPAVALCSLNWRDILAACCAGRSEAAPILSQMEESYRKAALFLQPAPSMEMGWLENRRPVGTIARRGRSRREAIEKRLNLRPGERMVLLSFGGITSHLPLARWPDFPGIRFIVSGGTVKRPGFHPLDELEIPYLDLLCSVDALITKPGYGSFSEAACNGVPVLYVPRDGWPEAPCLTTWLRRVGVCREIERAKFERGQFMEELTALFRQPPVPKVEPEGVEQVAEILCSMLV